MDVSSFFSLTDKLDINFYAGVPDSQLNPVCEYLRENYGACSDKHMVAANEGGAVGLAAGHYLATGKPALVYMQNSGLGNAINPICSLLNDKVYAIPTLFLIGWRGEPGTMDEPQHRFQGEITLKLLEDIEISYAVIDRSTTPDDLDEIHKACLNAFSYGKSYAIVVRKGAFFYNTKKKPENDNALSRERVLELIADRNDHNSVFVCTTGKLSRELFEIREKRNQNHFQDFLTVGSMGHSLMIAQGIALARPELMVWCIDGDGSMLMHMGSVAVAGLAGCSNLRHILINNGAHESVGGMPTAAANNKVKLTQIAKACGYAVAVSINTASNFEQQCEALDSFEGPAFIEIMTNLEVRADLGRPTTSPIENREVFMKYIRGEI